MPNPNINYRATKKCRIYTAFGVSQTLISIQHLRNILGGQRNCPHELLVEIACVSDISMEK